MDFKIGSGAVWLLRTIWSMIIFLIAVTVQMLFSLRITILYLCALVLGGIGWWYAGRWTSSFYGSVSTHTVYVRYGILWRREALISITALRAVELWTPPLHRLFCCRTAILRFAGGAIQVPFLSRADARRLCKFLESAEEDR